MSGVNYGQQPQYASPFIATPIANAAKNDPRMALAQGMVNTGTSTAPVATHGYGVADGLARMLTGLAGAYTEKKLMDKYGQDQNNLLATVKAQAQAAQQPGIGATPPVAAQAPTPPQAAAPAAGGNPALAANVAGVLSGGAGAPGAGAAGGMPPQGQMPPQGAQNPLARPLPGAGGANAGYIDPLAGRGRATSGFGARKAPVAGASTYHTGVDLAAPAGTPVEAAANGVVLSAGAEKGGGNVVRIRHPDGSVSAYAHLSGFNVKPGDVVQNGQVVGSVGQTGVATGPHLHFSITDAQGNKIDPRTVMSGTAAPATGQRGAAVPGGAVVPNIVAVPDMPALPDKPVAPTAEPATQSLTLKQAYRIMQDANPYQYDEGQRMLADGLGKQDELNERATARRQAVSDMVYQQDAGNYYGALNAQRQAQYGDRSAAIQHNYQQQDAAQGENWRRQDAATAQGYQWTNAEHEGAIQRRNAESAAADSYKRAIDLAKLKGEITQEGKTDPLRTPTGTKFWETESAAGQGLGDQVALLNELDGLNRSVGTGGVYNIPGVGAYARTMGSNHTALQRMEAIGTELGINLSTKLKGSISDKEEAMLASARPSMYNSREANQAIINRLRWFAQLGQDYHASRIEAYRAGGDAMAGFQRLWDKYRASVPVGSQVSFAQWQSSLPKFDATGRRIQ